LIQPLHQFKKLLSNSIEMLELVRQAFMIDFVLI